MEIKICRLIPLATREMQMSASNSPVRMDRWPFWMGMACLVGLAGCEDSAQQVAPPLRTAKTAPAAKPAGSLPADRASEKVSTTERDFGDAVFQVPRAWEEKPKRNDVIAAEFAVPGTAGPGRLTLSSATGGLTANVQRWRDQFQPEADSPEPKESTLSVQGQDATFVELFGTFRDSFSGGQPQRDWAMLGAVIPLKKTGEAYFVKLTGPRESLEANRDKFVKFVESAKFNE